MKFSKTALEAPSAGNSESEVQLLGLGDTLATFAPPHRLPTERGFFMEEIWKSILTSGFEGIYEISNIGRIRSTRDGLNYRINSPFVMNTGYYAIRLYRKPNIRKTVLIHSLVAESFIGKRPDCMHINHIDSNRLNNLSTNLEYITRQENMDHAKTFGGIVRGPQVSSAKLNYESVAEIRKSILDGASISGLAAQYGVLYCTIRAIKINKTWRIAQ